MLSLVVETLGATGLFTECAIGLGAAVFGLSTALLVQCGSNKRTTAKKGHGGSKTSAKSKRSSKRQLKSKTPSRKSKRSSKKSGRSQRSAKSASKKLARSRKSSRSSKRSAEATTTKTARQLPDVAAGKQQRQETSTARQLQESQSARNAQNSKPDELSVQETQRSLASKKNAQSLASQQAPQLINLPVNTNGAQSIDALNVEPRVLRFSQQGGLSKVALHNPTAERQAVKLKCSDNNLYRVNPVYGFVEPGNTLHVDVVRQNGNSKVDKLVFLTSKAGSNETDPKAPFKGLAKEDIRMVLVPLMA